MPGKVQDPNLSFRDQRLAAGLTVTALARQIGAPVQTVSRWNHGDNRPSWQWVLKLRDIFRRTAEELVALLWGEKVGDSCAYPHDCGGKKILPDDPLVLQALQPSLKRYIPRALKLLIKVPCAGCGRERPYTQSGPHPKFCPSCCDRGPKAERKKYTCVGYHRYGKLPDYGPSCPREEYLLPSEVYRRFKYDRVRRRRKKERWGSGKYSSVNWERPFIDESSGTYRCKSCAFASLRFEVQKARLEEIEGGKPRSESEHRGLWREYVKEFIPNFDSQIAVARRKELLGTKEGKERLYGERHRAGTSKGKTVAMWYSPPKSITIDLCLVCHTLTDNGKSHKECFLRWRKEGGRRYHKMPAEFFPSHLVGRPPKPENLKKYLCWAIRHCASGKKGESLREIAKESHCDHSSVRDGIKFILEHLPAPGVGSRRLQRIVSPLREAVIKKAS